MNVKMVFVMGISLLIILPVVNYILCIIDRWDKRKNNTGASLYLKKSHHRYISRIYQNLLQFPMTRGYVERISRNYEVLYPGEPEMIAEKVMYTIFTVLLICILEITTLFLLKPNLHNAILVIYLVFIINNEVLNYYIRTADIKLLESIEVFLSDISHNYYINRLVDDAIWLSMEGQSEDMKIHARKLYEIITSPNLKEEIAKYYSTTHNKYLKILLSLCSGVLEFSDVKVNGQLLFTSNLMHLKREINIEILKLKKLRHVFSGSVFVAVAVCVPIDAIQEFGISMVPELKGFYAGQGGIAFITLIFLVSAFTYFLINHVKEIKQPFPKNYRYLKLLERISIIKKALDNYTEKYYGRMLVTGKALKQLGETISPRQFILKRLIYSTITFVIGIGLMFYMHYSSRWIFTHNASSAARISGITNEEQIEALNNLMISKMNQYKKKAVTKEELISELEKENQLYATLTNEKIAEEILLQILKYQNEYFKWYEFIICMAAAVIAYFIPCWLLIYKKRVLKIAMEDEVNQFHSIIYMMMYMRHITVMDILEQMELFAVVFKHSIQECMNDYNSGDIEALMKMKERETYPPFRRMVDNLIRCDSIPIDKAFDEIASERENFHERRKQENEISIQRRADNVKPLAFIPAILVTIYLLLPMLAAGMQALEEFRESVSSMGF